MSKRRVVKKTHFPPAQCDPMLLADLKAYARQNEMSVSAVMRQAVRVFLSNNIPKSTKGVENQQYEMEVTP